MKEEKKIFEIATPRHRWSFGPTPIKTRRTRSMKIVSLFPKQPNQTKPKPKEKVCCQTQNRIS